MKHYFLSTISKAICTLMLILLGGICMQARQLQTETTINFQVSLEDDTKASGGFPRTPILPVHAALNDHTLYIIGTHTVFTLVVIDKNGDEDEVVYQTIMPFDLNSVELPATLSGDYEIQLHTGGMYYYYSEVEL